MKRRAKADCDHCAVTDRARELSIARAALAEDDVRHAAHHAAGALAFDPDDEESLALVDALIPWRPKPAPFSGLLRMLGKAGDDDDDKPDRAPAFPKDPWWGNHLVRARADRLAGDRAAALDAVIQIAAVARHLDLSTWWNGIIDEAERARERVPIGMYLHAYSELAGGTIGIVALRPLERAHFARWARLGRRLMRHAGDDERALLATAASGIARRAGLHDDAVAVADEALARARPEDRAGLTVQAGLALRAARRFDEAVVAFEAELASNPNHGLEIARTYADAARVQDAIACIDKYLDDDDGEVRAMRDLLCRRRGDKDVPERAHRVAVMLDEDAAPASYDDLRRLFIGHTWPHMEMTDATTSLLWSETPLAPGAKSFATTLEAPSVRLAMALAFGSTDPRTFHYSAGRVPSPDPREPLDASLGVRLWRADGDVVVQALPPPAPSTVQQVLQLAVPLRSTQHTWKRACAMRGSIDGDDVVRALTHPPPAPPEPGLNAASWLFRWQRCACLLLGAVDDAPWATSTRRRLLRSVAFANPDWTTAAAILALIEVALDDVDAADDIRDWLVRLSRATPNEGHCCWATAMQRAAGVLPHLPPNLLTPFKPWLEESDATEQ